LKALFAIVGILLFIGGICAGIYVGFWLMFVGGIMDIVNTIKAPVTEASQIGWGVLKMMFAGFTGAMTFYFCAFVAGAFIAAAAD